MSPEPAHALSVSWRKIPGSETLNSFTEKYYRNGRGKQLQRISAGIFAALLLLSALTLVFSISSVNASATIYIRSNGSIDPPTAPISSVDNITYIFTDNIYGEIVVERSNIIVDGKGYTVEGDGSGNGLTLYNVAAVTIKNLSIKKFTYGIYLELASNNILTGNTITENGYDGVSLQDSLYNNIIKNTITSNSWYGVGLYYSPNNSISENTITECYDSLWLYDSSNNTILQNKIMGNYNGIELIFSSDNTIFHNYFANNTIQIYTEYSTNIWDNGCEGNYWDDYNGTDLDGDGVGDTHLPWLDVDNYPLMNPYIKGDVNHDAVVDIFDAITLANAFDSTSASPNWNPYCDLMQDDEINIFDAIVLSAHFDETWA